MFVLLGAAAVGLQSCVLLRPAPVVDDDLGRDSLRRAVWRSISYLVKIPRERFIGTEPRNVTAGEVFDSLLMFARLLDREDCNKQCLLAAVEQHFDIIPSHEEADLAEVLFTGYYQPVIDASLVATDEFRYPLYRRPPELITANQLPAAARNGLPAGRVEHGQLTPYYTRRDIDGAKALTGRGLELAWLKDPVDAFFLHIQGSGILRLPDGQELSVGYAGQNGHAYRSIGRLLIDEGKIPKEEMSMQRLRRYLAEHPVERDEILNYNESYVFFRINREGPLGSLEVPLTAGRSLATDATLFPKGALVLVNTEIPRIGSNGELSDWEPVHRFVLNQDTGGAIRGRQRGDIYFGTGDAAGEVAGYMNRRGRMFFLLLKPAYAKTGSLLSLN